MGNRIGKYFEIKAGRGCKALAAMKTALPPVSVSRPVADVLIPAVGVSHLAVEALNSAVGVSLSAADVLIPAAAVSLSAAVVSLPAAEALNSAAAVSLPAAEALNPSVEAAFLVAGAACHTAGISILPSPAKSTECNGFIAPRGFHAILHRIGFGACRYASAGREFAACGHVYRSDPPPHPRTPAPLPQAVAYGGTR